MNFYVYILYSEKIDKYYTGHTDNIERRLKEHNSGQTRYTSQQGVPWKLVYSESFVDRSSAMKREKEIKAKKSKKYIQELIRSLERPV
jgi:putative endonuclease